MKKNFKLVLILLITFTNLTIAQVGINTSTPNASSELDIESTNKGILIPRLTTTERDAIVDPENSLLIFNETENEFQFNSNTAAAPIWSTVVSENENIGKSLKYSNTDVTTDLNETTEVSLPIFGSLDWNDNTSLYSVTGNTITVAEAGRYRIVVNCFLTSNLQRTAVNMQLVVNGNAKGSIAATAYMRNQSGHEHSSIRINEVLELAANSTIEVFSIAEANTSNNLTNITTLATAGTSNFYIEKIK